MQIETDLFTQQEQNLNSVTYIITKQLTPG